MSVHNLNMTFGQVISGPLEVAPVTTAPGKYIKKNDDSVKEAPAYCQSFLDGLHT